ncbi:MAG TPA: hypothetical protein VES65_07600 [Solirubrobacteraceae bacterium]|nr:hypothetical protein [Solirubrobacteraceae bacterium]
MHTFRRHLNYANVTATLALVFAMSGGALAAHHYLINSTKQIKPSVLKALKGNTGKTGATGKEGASGKEGKEGLTGKEGKTGPAGSSVGYVHVKANGEVDAENSKNVTAANVTRSGAGVYCFHNLPFTVHAVAVAPDAFGPTDGILVNPSNGTFGCGEEGFQLRVRTTLAAKPTEAVDEPFYVFFE